MLRRGGVVFFFLFILSLMTGCNGEEAAVDGELNQEQQEAKESIPASSPRTLTDSELRGYFEPLGPVPVPKDNPMTEEKVELGKTLFVDHRLSGDQTLSCLSCHAPGAGYADNKAKSKGFEGVLLDRHTPSVINTAYYDELFWDGRASSLEEQALGPIQNPMEMNQTLDGLVETVEGIEGYQPMFDEVFDGKINAENIAKAIAAFERTIIVDDTKHDRFIAGDNDALTEQEKFGMEIFVTKGNCLTCHSGPNFTDNNYHHVGIDSDDPGRYDVTQEEEDMGKFRTMGLRGIAATAPYMHDGRFDTIEEVVDYYDRGGDGHVNQSEFIQPLGLTEEEKEALVAYLHAISGDVPEIDIPELPE